MNGPGLLEALADLASAREPALAPRLPSVFESLEADVEVRDEHMVEEHDFVPTPDVAPIPTARHHSSELRSPGRSRPPSMPHDEAEAPSHGALKPSVARRTAARDEPSTEPDVPPALDRRSTRRAAAPPRPVDEPLNEARTDRLSADDELIAHHRIAAGPRVLDETQPERHSRELVPPERDVPESIFLPRPESPFQFSRRDAREASGEATASPVAPVINVTIGRVEVRAVPRDVKGAPRGGNGPESKRMSLDEYLERRAGKR